MFKFVDKKYDSLIHYIFENHGNNIRNTLMAYFKANSLYACPEEWEEPETYGFKVLSIEFAQPNVYYFQAPGTMLDFDMVVHAITTIQCRVGDEEQCDIFEDDFTFTMEGSIKNRQLKLKPISVVQGRHARDYDRKNSLSQFLVPFVSADQYEEYATEFLQKYYPEALKRPTRVKVGRVATAMGLDIKVGPLPSGSLGKLVFAEEKGKLMDFDAQFTVRDAVIPANTIIVSEKSFMERCLGSISNTVIHECVHKYLHERYFELQVLLNSGETSLTCYMKEMETPSKEKLRNKYFMEVQAKQIAPKILMPKEMAKKKFSQILNEIKRSKTCAKEKLYDEAVSKFASFFGTSIESSQYRLRELGFSSVLTSLKTQDNKTIRTYKSSQIIKSSQSYEIERDDLMYVLSKNEDLRKLVLNGVFVYVDKMLVLNNSKYYKKYSKGGCRLKNQALKDVSKCCVLFDNVIENSTISFNPESFNMITFSNGGYHTECEVKTHVDFKTGTVNKTMLETYKTTPDAKVTSAEFQKALAVVDELKKMSEFKDQLQYLIDSREDGKMSIRRAAELCFLDEKTFRNYLNGKGIPNQQKLYAICGGLKLHPRVSGYLFSSLIGYTVSFDSSNEKFNFYNTLLTTKFKDGLESWNTEIRGMYPDDSSALLP